MVLQKLKYKLRVLRIKFFSWEYWPMWVVYFPASFYFVYVCLKARSFFFFSAANPSIETGGMFFESKWKIFELIPKQYYPATIYIDAADDLQSTIQKMTVAGIAFPVIAKPDRGERGWCVKKLNNVIELEAYKRSVVIPFLIQAYSAYPLEFSIFYYRHPNSDKGAVTSVTLKKLLSVTGDAVSTIEQLIERNDRAFLQSAVLKQNEQINFNHILKDEEEEILIPYGNHVRGAMFLDYNNIVDEQLVNTFDTISKSIDGFYFGRYDLRCNSIEDLKQGKNFSILELNGAGAEPAHIYQPGFSFFKAQKVITAHYEMMYEAAKENKKRGFEYMSFRSFKEIRSMEKAHKQKQPGLNFNQ